MLGLGLSEVPRDVFHIVVAVVAHGQVVVVGQQPTSRLARSLVDDKSPVSREAHTVICRSRGHNSLRRPDRDQ